MLKGIFGSLISVGVSSFAGVMEEVLTDDSKLEHDTIETIIATLIRRFVKLFIVILF